MENLGTLFLKIDGTQVKSAILGKYLIRGDYKDNHGVREACYFVNAANLPGTVALARGAISRQ